MKQLFNNQWFFHKEALGTSMQTFFDTDDWQAVDVPHDWMIYDSEDLYAQGISCYKKLLLSMTSVPTVSPFFSRAYI